MKISRIYCIQGERSHGGLQPCSRQNWASIGSVLSIADPVVKTFYTRTIVLPLIRHGHFLRNRITQSQSMSCLVLRISIFHQLNECGKYIVLTPIICCSFRCGPCLGYEPAGTLFDLKKRLMPSTSNRRMRIESFRYSSPYRKKKGHYQ